MNIYETLDLNKKNITENTMSRLKMILLGRDKSIKYFCIGTPENPMGISLSSKENKERYIEFENIMKSMRIQYIKIVGSYGNKENSYILPNLDLNDAKNIFGYDGFDQESFIYGESNSDGVDYWYYQKNEGNSKYQLLDAECGITMMNDAEDFFSFKNLGNLKLIFLFLENVL